MRELIAELKAMQKKVWAEGLKDYCEAHRCNFGICDVAESVSPEQAKKIQQDQAAAWKGRFLLLRRLQITIDTLEKHEERSL